MRGGIDLTSGKWKLQIQNNPKFRQERRIPGEKDRGIKFHLDPAMLQQLQNAPGFLPVIIDIEPLGDLRIFLGLKGPYRGDGIKL